MNPLPIAELIQHLSDQIAVRQDAIVALQKLQEPGNAAIEGPSRAPTPPQSASPSPVAARPKVPRGTKSSGRPGSNPDYLSVVAKLKEPFQTGDLATALGCTHKYASNRLFRLKIKGWLASPGHGLFTRTEQFVFGSPPRSPAYAHRSALRDPPSPLPAPLSSSPSLLLPNGAKPTSLGAAMKLWLATRQETFTIPDIIAALEADPHCKKLLEEASPNSMYGNLSYWSKGGKLKQEGDGRESTFTILERDWLKPAE